MPLNRRAMPAENACREFAPIYDVSFDVSALKLDVSFVLLSKWRYDRIKARKNSDF